MEQIVEVCNTILLKCNLVIQLLLMLKEVPRDEGLLLSNKVRLMNKCVTVQSRHNIQHVLDTFTHLECINESIRHWSRLYS